ncbi:unnamed protein product [Lepeophtheirus salmonis]|uniref:(salmon louse) hypothetical protein n=1 Tax=Lepeophtheirus salmonis TaxID=72036 RepID=A0A7R8CJJ3_LEPSM|nr:unnamed protein product [Lepeophtheirus salmonis]CAF2842364.1 unnamed protein product [Lepeophtheirus salmonis]
MIETTSTGIYNYRSLGIKNIRQIEASRGGREGNNALTKDDTKSKSDLSTFALSKKLSVDFFEFLIEEKVVSAYLWPEISKAFFSNGSITPLHLACLNPNVNVLKSLLSVSSNLWIEDSQKRSLIHYAAACTKGIYTLKYLFSKSVSLEGPDKEGYTPLIIASNIENVEAMEFIILNLSKDSEFDTAVESKFKSLKVLLKHKARVDKPLNTKYGKLTALMLASGMGNLEMVKFLVEHGQAKVETLDKFKRSALTHAVMNGATNVDSYLFKLGTDPDRKDSSGNSNLHYACAYGWYHCAVLLLETGAVPDPVNEWKISPTAIAFLRGHRGLGEYMLQIPGVCTNFQDDKGRTLLMELLRVSPDTCTVDKVINDRNNTDRMGILEQILALCKLQNDTTVDGFNALHLSINNSTDDFNINLEIESLLFKCGVNPILQDSFGRIPLHYAFIKNDFKKSVRSEYKFIPGEGNNLLLIDPIEVVSMTIDGMQGKLVDTVDENGSSPLHYASYRGSTVCCMLLVDHNADIDRMDRFGNTPLAYAIIGNNEATTITLLQKGANVNCKVHINPFLMGFSETQIVKKDDNQSSAFKFLPSHFKKPAKSQFPMTLFQLSLLNGWLGVSYLILERMEKHGLRIAEALEAAFKLNKLQLAKKLTLKQLDNSKLCELVDNKQNLISSMIKVVGNSSKDNLLIEFIFNHLYKAGNKLQHKDISGCTVLHYGCLTNNIDILKLILSYFESKYIINKKDNNGRTPLVATLWKCQLESSFVLVKELFKPHPSTVNLTYEDDRNAELTELTTPLIIAINFKCRSLIDLLLEHGVDVNLPDGKGRTPLMIAVKSNGIDFIKYFLNASISHLGSNLDNTPPLSKKRKFQKIIKLDIQAKDVEGYNVGHLVLVFRNTLFDASHDNVEVIKFLLENEADFLDTQNMASVSAVNIAEKMRLNEVYKLLTKVDLCPPHVSHILLESNFPYNIVKDAQAMFDILSNNSCDENGQNVLMEVDEKVDANSDDDQSFDENYKESDDEEGNDINIDECVENPRMVPGLCLKSGFLFQGYTALLSKICTDHGEWGIYNFYQMQIWKDQVKKLYVLFTNWGRWGDVGKYQNTPFGRPEQAFCEFEKIFKSKTGNDWSNRQEFVPKLNNYRQLDIT